MTTNGRHTTTLLPASSASTADSPVDQPSAVQHHRTRTRTAVAALALVATLATAACSSTSSSPSKTAAPGRTSGPSVGSASALAPAKNTLDIVGLDYKYKISGIAHPGLVTITFGNQGKYAHEMALQQLKPGATLTQVKTALKSPNGEKALGALLIDPTSEITGPAILGPGKSETVTANLAAGRYLVICFLPGPHGMPHALMGMLGELTVAGAKSTATAPPTDGTVTLKDNGITVPATFAEGGTFAVTNTGTKPHDFSTAALKTQPLSEYFQCVGGSFGKGTPIDNCPGTLTGGVTTLQPGHTAYLNVTLAKGRYGYVSTGGDNGADFQAGLNGTFTVQ